MALSSLTPEYYQHYVIVNVSISFLVLMVMITQGTLTGLFSKVSHSIKVR